MSNKDNLIEKINLLLVEDDKDFSNALIPRLIRRNFNITVADSAESAL
ncbi:two-component system response regulator, partial [Candidatus Desantisbacteria bacterium]|nr:two-component system response regulator [Candidatus Desantisbacteria bacterium]